MNLADVSCRLARDLADFGPDDPVAFVYNPLEYAREPHERYLRRYGTGTKRIVLLGMNPGPWGMAQTGVPFGEVRVVREWLDIEGAVDVPTRLHPKRPVTGFACTRSEVSGTRLWGWARERFATPERFFSRFFVANYCPLVFYDRQGRNLTPDKLPRAMRDPLFAACDCALSATAKVLRPEWVIGVGRFAFSRAEAALRGTGMKVGQITHPSPANPKANRGWGSAVDRELGELGIEVPGAI